MGEFDDFKFKEVKGEEAEKYMKLTFMIYGVKGHAKTTTGLGLEGKGNGKFAVLMYDEKTIRAKKEMYEDDSNIVIWDAAEFIQYGKGDPRKVGEMDAKDMDVDPKILRDSLAKTYIYTLYLLNQIAKNYGKEHFDWIMFDAAGIMEKATEMQMRKKHGLSAFQGVSPRSLWNERGQMMNRIHEIAMNLTKKGVIYTTYPSKDYDTTIIKDGDIIKQDSIPKWVGDIMLKTDVVMRTFIKSDKGGDKWLCKIETSKKNYYPSGILLDLSYTTIHDVLEKWHKKSESKRGKEKVKAAADIEVTQEKQKVAADDEVTF